MSRCSVCGLNSRSNGGRRRAKNSQRPKWDQRDVIANWRPFPDWQERWVVEVWGRSNMGFAVITWKGGTKTIEGATLDDSRVKEELDRLAKMNANNVKIEFHVSFDIGRHIDDEEEYD